MSDQSERPVPKFKPVAPERVLISIKVSPETKARFERLAEVMTMSLTKTLEMAAERFEELTLRRLKPEDREIYLAGTLDAATTLIDGRKFRRRKVDVPDETAVISAKITTEARVQFDRYARFYKMPLAQVLGRLSINLEKGFKRRRPPEAEPREPMLDPDLAQRLMPVPEPEEV
jgi:hypothetical protein